MERIRLYLSANRGSVGWHILQRGFIDRYPGLLLMTERLFLTEPAITSYVVSLPQMDAMDLSFLDQFREQRALAWYEQASGPASLRWMYTVLPREDTSQAVLRGMLTTLGGLEAYKLCIFDTDVRLTGINDRTGATCYSPAEPEDGVASLSFSLEAGERLILWCRQREGDQEAVATALFHRGQDGRVEREAADGIEVFNV